MYAPIYLSNECLTTCTYCGFAKDLDIVRRTLTAAEAVREAEALKARGFRHLLLLTGEHQKLTGVDFLEQAPSRALARRAAALDRGPGLVRGRSTGGSRPPGATAS